jgi:hypothetical protein
MITYYEQSDIISGIITNVNRDSRKGHSYLFYEIQDKNKNIYINPDEIKHIINIGDKVTFRTLHYSNSARILTVNNHKINSYYYLADYFSVFYLLSCVMYIIYKYKNYKK